MTEHFKKTITIIFLPLLCVACITKDKKLPDINRGQKPKSENKENDVGDLHRPKLEMKYFDVGGVRLLNLLAYSEKRGEFYSYQICLDSTTNKNCRSGTISWGNRMLLLEPGVYKLSIKACISPFRANKGENCGPSETYYYKQVPTSNPEIASKIKMISNISQEIKSYTANIIKDLTDYKTSNRNLDSDDRFDELVDNQLKIGEAAIAQMLNSPEFYLYYSNFSKHAAPEKIEITEEDSLGDIATLEKKIEDLSQKLSALDSQQKDLSTDIENDPAGSLIMALGSSAIISGIITFSVGISTKLGFEKSAINVANSPFDIISNVLQSISGRSVPRTWNDLKGDYSIKRVKLSNEDFPNHVFYTNAKGSTKNLEYVVLKEDARSLEEINSRSSIVFEKSGILQLDIPNNNFFELDKATYEKYPEIQFAYKLRSNKAVLLDGFKSRFVVYNDQVYHLKYSSFKKNFPKLSTKTLEHINDHLTKLYQKGKYYDDFAEMVQKHKQKSIITHTIKGTYKDTNFNIDEDYMKGVPLLHETLDEKGVKIYQLIEPADQFKIPGKNWFDANNKRIRLDRLIFEYKDLNSPPPKNIKTMKDWEPFRFGIVKNEINKALWEAEIALKTNQLATINQTKQAKIAINKYSRKSMYAGALLMAAGISAIIGVMVSENYQLVNQNGPKQRLLKKFDRYESEIKLLHEKRLVLLKEINILSSKNRSISNLWIYSF